MWRLPSGESTKPESAFAPVSVPVLARSRPVGRAAGEVGRSACRSGRRPAGRPRAGRSAPTWRARPAAPAREAVAAVEAGAVDEADARRAGCPTPVSVWLHHGQARPAVVPAPPAAAPISLRSSSAGVVVARRQQLADRARRAAALEASATGAAPAGVTPRPGPPATVTPRAWSSCGQHAGGRGRPGRPRLRSGCERRGGVVHQQRAERPGLARRSRSWPATRATKRSAS